MNLSLSQFRELLANFQVTQNPRSSELYSIANNIVSQALTSDKCKSVQGGTCLTRPEN